jgi:hypothetical protein
MYKYFPEMEHLANFKTYLLDKRHYNIIGDVSVWNIPLKEEFINKYKDLLEIINYINTLMKLVNHDLEYEPIIYKNLSDEGIIEFNRLILKFNEEKEYENIIDINNVGFIWSFTEFLRTYVNYSSYLCTLFPDSKYLNKSHDILFKALRELEDKNTIKIQPNSNETIEFIWPNAWYITPNGFLYNTNGKRGHKGGNLIYEFESIKHTLESQGNIRNICYSERIKKILESGYILYDEFDDYCNSKYDLLTVDTPDIIRVRETYKKYLEYFEDMKEEEHDIFCRLSYLKLYLNKKSYQKNLITLITGYYAAEESFHNSFVKLNESNKKPELLEKILDLSQGCLEDILVKYSDFSKIETCEKKITTSSMNGIKEFKLYLEKGWDLYIVPKIIYDKENDDIFEMDFKSYFIDKYFDKELSEYNGKGRVLIRDVNC